MSNTKKKRDLKIPLNKIYPKESIKIVIIIIIINVVIGFLTVGIGFLISVTITAITYIILQILGIYWSNKLNNSYTIRHVFYNLFIPGIPIATTIYNYKYNPHTRDLLRK